MNSGVCRAVGVPARRRWRAGDPPRRRARAGGRGRPHVLREPEIRARASAHARDGRHLGEDAPAAPCAMLRTEASVSRVCQRRCAFSCRPRIRRPASITQRGRSRCDARTRCVDRAVLVRSAAARASAIARSSIPNVCIGDGAVVGDDCVIHSHVGDSRAQSSSAIAS